MFTKLLPTLALPLVLAACGGGGGGSIPAAAPSVQVASSNHFTVSATFDCSSTGCSSTSAPGTVATVQATGKTLTITLTGVSDVGCDGRLTDGAANLSLIGPNGGVVQSFGSVDNGNFSSATYTYGSATVGATYTWKISVSPSACSPAATTKTATVSGTYAAGP